MGKSGKLFKGLVTGVRAFKAPSKQNPNREEKEQRRKGNKDKCLWRLGKSSSRNRDTATPPRSPASCDVVDIKVVQVEHQTAHISPICKDSLPATNVPVLDLKQVAAVDSVQMSEREKWAVTKIQATFRCYLAYRDCRALKALVKLQALVRGRIVRRQAATTFRCMQAIIRIQALVRGRHVRLSELGQLVHKHLHQIRQQRRKPVEGWVSSMASMKELQAKAQSKQEAIMKRQRALVYASSEQLRRPAPKQNLLVVECQPDTDNWPWTWLERWMAACPWENGLNAVKEWPCVVSAEQTGGEEVTVTQMDLGNGEQYTEDVSGHKYGEAFDARPRENSSKEELYSERLTEKPNKESNEVGPLNTHMTPSLETHPIDAMEKSQPVTAHSMGEKSPPSSPHSIAISMSAIVQAKLGSSAALNVSSSSFDLSSSSLGPLGAPNRLSSSLPSSVVNISIMEDSMPRVVASLQQHQSTAILTICGTEDHLSLQHANTTVVERNGHQEKSPAVNSTYEEKLDACWDDNMVRADNLSDMNSRCSSVVSVSPVVPEVTSRRLSNPGGSKNTDGASPLIPSYMAPTQSAKAKIRAHISPKQKSDSPNSTALSSGPPPRRRHSLSGLETKSPPTTQRRVSHVRAASKGQGQLASVKDGDASLNSNAESCSSHCK